MSNLVLAVVAGHLLVALAGCSQPPASDEAFQSALVIQRMWTGPGPDERIVAAGPDVAQACPELARILEELHQGAEIRGIRDLTHQEMAAGYLDYEIGGYDIWVFYRGTYYWVTGVNA